MCPRSHSKWQSWDPNQGLAPETVVLLQAGHKLQKLGTQGRALALPAITEVPPLFLLLDIVNVWGWISLGRSEEEGQAPSAL